MKTELTQAELQARLNEAELELRNPNLIGEFSRYLDTLMFTVRPRTATEYLKVLRSFQTQDQPLLNWLIERPNSIRLFSIRKALKLLDYKDILEQDFLKYRKGPVQRPMTRLSKEDRRTVIMNIKSAKYRLVAWMQHDTGARVKEILGLKQEQMLAGEGDRVKLHIIRKGNREGYVYLSKDTSEMLEVYLQLHADREFPFLEPGVGYDANYKQYELALSASLSNFYGGDERKSSRRFGTHGFRYGLAQDILEKGGSVLDVKEALGHADVNTTMRYLQGLGISSLDIVKNLRESEE